MMLRHKRYDLRVTRMAQCRIEVYWRADDLGCGPCMSLYVGGRERMRFDLFDPAHWHHASTKGAPRAYYPPGLTLAEYAERAMADLAENYPPAARACGWAAEQLLAVRGPSVPVRRPVVAKRPFARRGPRRAPARP